jgi:hypothetical protein
MTMTIITTSPLFNHVQSQIITHCIIGVCLLSSLCWCIGIRVPLLPKTPTRSYVSNLPAALYLTSSPYRHRFSMMLAPCSSYSFLLIQSWWKLPKLAKILPPIQAAYLRSTTLPGAMSLLRVLG